MTKSGLMLVWLHLRSFGMVGRELHIWSTENQSVLHTIAVQFMCSTVPVYIWKSVLCLEVG